MKLDDKSKKKTYKEYLFSLSDTELSNTMWHSEFQWWGGISLTSKILNHSTDKEISVS